MKWLIALALLCLPVQGYAVCAVCSCTVASAGVPFGNYVQSAATTNSAQITVTCLTVSTPATVAYTIALNAGGGSFATRQLANGAQKLSYNLYTDPNHNYIWGDATGGTSTDTDSYFLSVLTAKNYPLYGLIPSGQNVASGSYADTIMVTVTY